MDAKKKAVSISLRRAEGRPVKCITVTHDAKTGDVWAAARATLLGWARTAPEGGGYDKCDFWVRFEDGETYEGRLDLTRDGDDTDVARHMTAFLECYALRRVPLAYVGDPSKEAAFRRHVLEDCGDTHAVAGKWLDEYQIGGAS